MDRSALPGLLALLAAFVVEVMLVSRTPGFGFIGAGLAALGAGVMTVAFVMGKPEVVDIGLGITLLGAVAAVAGAGREAFGSLAFQAAPVGLVWIGWRVSEHQLAKRNRSWADEFLAREAERDYRRP